MHRAFFSLYFLIVISVVGVGWSLDKFLQLYEPSSVVSVAERDLLAVLEQRLQSQPEAQWERMLQIFATNLDTRVELLSVSDFAQSKLADDLRQGGVVTVNNRDGDKLLYKQLPLSQRVLSVRQPAVQNERSVLYQIFIIVFYTSIAVVVFLWVWPLSRDLRKLERLTRWVGDDQLPEKLAIHPTSTVYDLATAFNRMSRRIRNLVASHQEMTYAVSHELRTPLARMKFALAMAHQSDDVAKVKKQLASVKDDVAEMDNLVNQLLTYAGFEQSSQKLDLQLGDMGYLIQQLIQRLTLSGAGNEITFEFSDLLEAPVLCEWHLMERVMLNLLQNAQRFAQQIVVVTLFRQNNAFAVMIDDDGPGIPDDERERVFQSFVRLSNHTNAQARGFGLGLAIVHRIIEWHGGSVHAERSPLGGARLVMTWPCPV